MWVPGTNFRFFRFSEKLSRAQHRGAQHHDLRYKFVPRTLGTSTEVHTTMVAVGAARGQGPKLAPSPWEETLDGGTLQMGGKMGQGSILVKKCRKSKSSQNGFAYSGKS